MEKEIVVFHQFDPSGNRIGGIGKYVLSFIKNASPDYIFRVVGVTRNKSELYRWTKILIGGRTVDFLPVCVVGNENIKSKIPLTVRYVLGLLRVRSLIESSSVLFMHRIEYIIPFIFRKNKKYLVVHNDVQKQLDPKASEFLWARAPSLFKAMFGLFLHNFTYIFSVNKSSVDYIRLKWPGKCEVGFFPTWADRETFAIPTSEEKINARAEIGLRYCIQSHMQRLIFVGRFQKQKNIELLITSLSYLEDCVLLMAGDGDELDRVKELARRLKVEQRVVFLGSVPHAELSRYIYSSDAYVSSSNFEGMSVALLEALQSGVPVITTPTGESKDIIRNGFNGVVTEGWCPKEFSGAVTKVLSLSHDTAEACISSVASYQAPIVVSSILQKMEEKHNAC